MFLYLVVTYDANRHIQSHFYSLYLISVHLASLLCSLFSLYYSSYITIMGSPHQTVKPQNPTHCDFIQHFLQSPTVQSSISSLYH